MLNFTSTTCLSFSDHMQVNIFQSIRMLVERNLWCCLHKKVIYGVAKGGMPRS